MACNGQGVLSLACNCEIKLTVAPAIFLQPLRNAFHWLAPRSKNARRVVARGTLGSKGGAIDTRAAARLLLFSID